MNEEIKQILRILKKCEYGACITKYNSIELLDYINNLQQDYDNEAEENLKLSEWLVEKQQRITELEEINRGHQEINAELRAENKRLKLYLDKLFMVIKEMSEMIK